MKGEGTKLGIVVMGGGILFSYFLVQILCGTESLEICGEQSVSEDYCR